MAAMLNAIKPFKANKRMENLTGSIYATRKEIIETAKAKKKTTAKNKKALVFINSQKN
jgi:hypothetical protein